MTSTAWSTTLKAILSIGLLFGLFILIQIRGVLKKSVSKSSVAREGFQSYGGTTQMKRATTDPLNTPAETPEEQVLYDLYEEKNIPIPPDPYYTPLRQYSTAGQLSKFDTGTEIPWDYDNKDMDPQEILWGTVFPECSQSIFTKAYNRETFSSGNNVEMDQGTGQFYYRSNVFQTTVYDQQSAAAIQYLEFVQDYATENVFEGILGTFAERLRNRLNARDARDAAERRANKLLSMKPTDAVSDINTRISEIKSAFAKERAPGTNAFTNFAEDFIFEKEGGRIATKADIEAFSQKYPNEAKEFQTAKQADIDEALSPLEKKLLKGDTIVDKTVNATEDGKSAYAKVYQEVAKEQAEKTLEKGRLLRGKGGVLKAWERTKVQALEWAKNKLIQPGAVQQTAKPIQGAAKSVAEELAQKAVKQTPEAARVAKFTNRSKVLRAIAQTVSEKLTTLSAIKLFGPTLSKVLMAPFLKIAGTFFAKAVGRLLVGMGIAMGVLAPTGPAGWIISGFLMVFSIVCISIVPAFMSQLVDPDPDLSTCPIIDGKETFNIRDSVVNSSGAGEAGWELLSSIPVLGDVMYAIGPYVCSEPNGTPHLRVPFQPPPYYFDSTLSIFFANKPKIMGCNRDLIADNVNCANADDAYKDVRKYYECKNPAKCTDDERANKYQWNIYWVDFANKKMLDKMAQHYQLVSRKFYNVEYDGRISYEYISKFYGIIASSQYSCDVQCEITKVIFEPYSGNNYEKVVLEPPKDTGMRYHDRRFYFTVDVRKGTYKPSNAPPTDTRDSRESLVKGPVPPGIDRWDVLMNDNMDKYVITGCTHVNGTAYDASDGSAEGSYVGDAVVALGNPGENYSPPIMVVGDETKLPQSQTECDGFRVSYSRPGMRYAPAQRGSENTSTPIVGNIFRTTKFVEPWGNAKYNDKGEILYSLGGQGFQVMRLQGSETKEWGVIRKFPSRLQEGLDATFTGVMGSLPLFFGFRGGLAATTVQSAPVVEGKAIGVALSCLWQDVKTQEGTFILNARTFTNAEHFVINRGPTLEFAPGYTPTLTPCMNVDTGKEIQLTSVDCANRFSLRRAIHYYHSNYKEGGKQFRLLRIFDIEPRRKTATNPASMCVYSVEEVEFDPITRSSPPGAISRTSVIGIEHSLLETIKAGVSTNDDTCVFYPVGITPANPLGIRNSNNPNAQLKSIPPLETIQMGFKEYDFSKTEPPPSSATFSLRNCNNGQQIDCSHPALRATLQAEFDLAHFAKDYVTIGDPANLLKSYTPEQSSGQNTCVYYANLEKLDYSVPEDNPAYRTRINATISMDFKETVEAAGTCAVELLTDDFSLGYSYVPIPGPTRWFDVPLPAYPLNPSVLRTTCAAVYRDTDDPRRPPYSSCSGAPIISALIQGFNEQYDTQKILRVFRANTPMTAACEQDRIIECDYEVDMMRRLNDGRTLVQRETIRIQGTPVSNSKLPCDYQYSLDYSGFPNSGVSIDKTGIVRADGTQSGALDAPVLWSASLLTSLRNKFNSVIAPLSNLGGKTIPEAMKAVSRPARMTMDNLNSFVVGSQGLANCPNMSCSSEELMTRVINRYNFDNYPLYPTEQFGVVKRTLERIRRAGFGGPSTCHFELIERIDTYNDFVEKPVTTQLFLRKYQFNIENSQSTGTECSYRIQPLSKEAIANNLMDISGNPYGIRADQSLLAKEFVKEDLGINPMDTEVLRMLKRAYDSTNTRKTPTGTGLNVLKSIKFAFNPRPNVCEYCAVVDHMNYDREYGMSYKTENDTTYIVVRWDEGTAYTVDAAQIRPNAVPTSVEEYFPGDIDVRADGAYLGTTRVNPPYLFFEAEQEITSNPSKYRVVLKAVDMTKL